MTWTSQVTQGKESTCQCRRHRRCRFHPWVGKIPEEGNQFQHSHLKNPMDRDAWQDMTERQHTRKDDLNKETYHIHKVELILVRL